MTSFDFDSDPDRTPAFVLLATILASAMAFMDGSVVTVALPAIRAGLGASFAQAQWTSNAYTLTLAAFTLLGGAAGDAFGLRRVFMAGIALFGLASAACGLAWSPESLIVARAIQGIGGALMVPGSLALISAHHPPDVRGRAIGTWAAASSIAPAIGPILGGALVDAGSWRFVFFLNLPLAAVALWLCESRVPRDDATKAIPMDWIGGGLAVVGLGALAYGLTGFGAIAAQDELGGAIGATAFGVVALIGFVAWERLARSPMMPLQLFANRVFAAVNGLTLLLYFALAGALFFLPTALIQAQAYPATLAGSVFLPFVIVMGLLSRFGGGLADRLGVRPCLTIGPILTGIAFALLSPAVANGSYAYAIVPVMALMGLGMGITVAPLSTAVMNAAPEERRGAASGINNAVARVAGLVAVASLGIAVAVGMQLATRNIAPDVAAIVRTTGFGGTLPQGGPAGLHQVFVTATLSGFAIVAWICAALAILSGLIAWFFMRDAESGA